ncbi:MAG: hypothetical protein V1875_04190 [Candidatus Altiarchaeota archaeon]
MNLYRLFNLVKSEEPFRARSRLMNKLSGKGGLTEDELNELFAYKHVEYHSNPDVRKITEKVFATSDLGEKFRLLRRLNGVGLLMASTILTYQNPHKYAEIDPSVWNMLIRDFGFKVQEKGDHSDYSIPEYLSYLEILKSLADEYGMNTSDVAFVLSMPGK